MSEELLPITQPMPTAVLAQQVQERLADVLGLPHERLVSAWIAGKKPETIRAYEKDLRFFREWMQQQFGLGNITSEQAAELLVRLPVGEANATVLAWIEAMRAADLKDSTVSRRVSALKSLVKMARMLGLCSYSIEVKAPRGKTYKDTRGPGVEVIQAAFELASRKQPPRAQRDLLVFSLMFHQGFRRGEIERLDLSDVDGLRLWVMQKDRREKLPVALSRSTETFLKKWIEVRPSCEERALLLSFSNRSPRQRLTAEGIYYILSRYGRELEADHRFHPHGFRHTAITEVLSRSGGNMALAQQFARHNDPKTTMYYLDNLQGMYREAADLLHDGLVADAEESEPLDSPTEDA